MAATRRAFCADYYVWRSDWLMLLGWWLNLLGWLTAQNLVFLCAVLHPLLVPIFLQPVLVLNFFNFFTARVFVLFLFLQTELVLRVYVHNNDDDQGRFCVLFEKSRGGGGRGGCEFNKQGLWRVQCCWWGLVMLQIVWRGRAAIGAEEMDTLFWRCDRHHLLCGDEWIRSGATRRWNNCE